MILLCKSPQQMTMRVTLEPWTDKHSVDVISLHCVKSSSVLRLINWSLQGLYLHRNRHSLGSLSKSFGWRAFRICRNNQFASIGEFTDGVDEKLQDLASTTAGRCPLCPLSDRDCLALQYVAMGQMQTSRSHPAAARPRRGSRTVNSVKSPTSLLTVMVPPCCCVTIS